MSAWTHVWDEATKKMNQSVLDRNAAREKQGGIRWDHEQRKMFGELEDNALMRELMRAKIARMKQPMPDFYGDGPQYVAPQSASMPQEPPEWYFRPGKSSEFSAYGKGGGNALAKLLGSIK